MTSLKNVIDFYAITHYKDSYIYFGKRNINKIWVPTNSSNLMQTLGKNNTFGSTQTKITRTITNQIMRKICWL